MGLFILLDWTGAILVKSLMRTYAPLMNVIFGGI